jgi:hypothetical protein
MKEKEKRKKKKNALDLFLTKMRNFQPSSDNVRLFNTLNFATFFSIFLGLFYLQGSDWGIGLRIRIQI